MVSQEVPQIIIDLVENFKENEHLYKSASYDEENTKVEFINPFFEALGWDVNNKSRASPRFKEVVFEDTIKIGGKAKAPDYSFRLGGQRIFFVEAKKPSVNIDTDKNPAYQIRRYGWSAKLPLCILTDFEELAVYETTTRPDKNQNASIGRIKYYKYTEYIDKWEEIYNIFSKEAVLSGKFDNYANNTKGIKKGTSEVDKEFLKEIDRWRELLARNIALRNPEVTIGELNHAVQLTIDRIIFLRMAEDRGIEKYQQLKNLLQLSSKNKDEYAVYEGFLEICKKADAKYNSGLFHFTEEKEISLDADNLTPNLKIDDKVFKDILAPMYYPDCPYEFSVISPEILGNVYERFLGKEIRLTKSHQAKIEYKPEVQKAGGVYYTPQYIVKYIVQKTVGELIKDKTPNQVSKLKFIDPACGSGSFLLEIYQYLLDWHLDYYSNLERVPKDVIFVGKDGITRLTINEKKRIVLNNIYGVDIDSQAVEVTKLSLLLKVLEDQNKDVIEQQQKLFQERALPYLGDNIRCGNSLIGTDILEQEDLTMQEISKLNPFDWEDEFKEVFDEGGFDVVVGNPPYVNVENIDEISKKYYSINYDTFVKRSDLFSVFIDLSLNKLTKDYLSFIVPSILFSNVSYKKLRNLILDENYLDEICYTGQNVFEGVTVDTTILIINKEKKKNLSLVNATDFNRKKIFNVKYDYFKQFDNIISLDNENTIKIVNKLFNDNFTTLKENFSIFQGIVTGYNPAFIFESQEDALKHNIEEDLLKPVCFGKDINQWEIENDNNRILYIDSNCNLKNYPNVKSWLSNFSRKDLKKKQLHRPRKKDELDLKEKILIQATRNERLKRRVIGTIDDSSIYSTQGLWNIIPKTDKYSLYFLICILNSNAINYIFATKFLNLGIKKDYLNKIEFPKLSLEEQKPFIDLAKKMLAFHKQLNKSNVPNESRLLKKQIDITGKKINGLVYELYDLSEDEIEIIENSLN